MKDIALPLQDLLRSMDAQAADALAVRKVHDAFAQSVIEVYGLEAAKLVLKHVQGVSIVKDDGPYKSGVRPPAVLHVYADDSLVVSDLDARQHVLGMCLRKRGVHPDAFKFYFSRFGMRERAPFADYFDHEGRLAQVAQSAQDVRDGFDQASDAAQLKRLQILKVALCQVFGEDAQDVVSCVNAAYCKPCGKRSCTVSMYVADAATRDSVAAAEDAICAHARDLGMPVARFAVKEAEPWMASMRAFPPMSAPVIVRQ